MPHFIPADMFSPFLTYHRTCLISQDAGCVLCNLTNSFLVNNMPYMWLIYRYLMMKFIDSIFNEIYEFV